MAPFLVSLTEISEICLETGVSGMAGVNHISKGKKKLNHWVVATESYGARNL